MTPELERNARQQNRRTAIIGIDKPHIFKEAGAWRRTRARKRVLDDAASNFIKEHT